MKGSTSSKEKLMVRFVAAVLLLVVLPSLSAAAPTKATFFTNAEVQVALANGNDVVLFSRIGNEMVAVLADARLVVFDNNFQVTVETLPLRALGETYESLNAYSAVARGSEVFLVLGLRSGGTVAKAMVVGWKRGQPLQRLESPFPFGTSQDFDGLVFDSVGRLWGSFFEGYSDSPLPTATFRFGEYAGTALTASIQSILLATAPNARPGSYRFAAADKQGNVYFARREGDPVLRVDSSANLSEWFLPSEFVSRSLRQIYHLTNDNDGRLWLLVPDPKDQAFLCPAVMTGSEQLGYFCIEPFFDPGSGLNGPLLNRLEPGPQGDWWVAGAGVSFSRISPSFRQSSERLSRAQGLKAKSLFGFDGFARGPGDTMWIFTKSKKGFVRIDNVAPLLAFRGRVKRGTTRKAGLPTVEVIKSKDRHRRGHELQYHEFQVLLYEGTGSALTADATVIGKERMSFFFRDRKKDFRAKRPNITPGRSLFACIDCAEHLALEERRSRSVPLMIDGAVTGR